MTDAWVPSTLDALEEAVRSGVVLEGHHLDFKRELAPGAAGNKSLSKDLAAFAVDGGRIVVGVEEQAGGAPAIRPVALSGLKERADQVARSSVTPPLHVRCVELPTAADPSQGCLVIVVPPSPAAPHQAADRLWGRGDTTNHVLSAREIDELYERRSRRRASMETLLQEEILRDPTTIDLREFGHLFVVAQPDVTDEELFFRALDDRDFSAWLHKVLVPTLAQSTWAPDLTTVGEVSRRARGWAVHDYCISDARSVRPNGERPAKEKNLLDVEVREDGGVRLFCGRATDALNGAQFLDAVVCGLILRVVEVAREVAGTTSFWGSWRFGVALTNIRGAVSHHSMLTIGYAHARFSEDDYRRETTSTYEELRSDLVEIVERLAGPLLRGFGSAYPLSRLRTPRRT